MPNNATSNGSCLYKDENHQAITIRWAADDGNLEDFNSITITFERNQSRYTITEFLSITCLLIMC